ncbi:MULTISPECIES: hypothetical protein [Bacillus]|uniref:hypothetical protein n=1 Tax=Bacillus TaxID=1386 RepID=UPI0023DF0645|nr:MULTISPECIES: hypothetical protein [Bacillus]MDF3255020.1 hypothetical protein [Bacillus velezensis]MDF3267751.1 hypothetical protein [Bacillus velezensis]
MKFTEKQLESIHDESGFYKEEGNEDSWVDVEQVEQDDWTDGGKYSYCQIIFKYEGKHYAFAVTRSGSYFSYYEYEYDTDVTEVEQVTETVEITKWVAVG